MKITCDSMSLLLCPQKQKAPSHHNRQGLEVISPSLYGKDNYSIFQVNQYVGYYDRLIPNKVKIYYHILSCGTNGTPCDKNVLCC